jgi:hypothetical protein
MKTHYIRHTQHGVARVACGRAGSSQHPIHWTADARGVTCGTCLRLAAETAIEDLPDCKGHPAGTGGPIGQTVYCDGTCNSAGVA